MLLINRPSQWVQTLVYLLVELLHLSPGALFLQAHHIKLISLTVACLHSADETLYQRPRCQTQHLIAGGLVSYCIPLPGVWLL